MRTYYAIMHSRSIRFVKNPVSSHIKIKLVKSFKKALVYVSCITAYADLESLNKKEPNAYQIINFNIEDEKSTNKEFFLAGKNFIYDGKLYRLKNRVVLECKTIGWDTLGNVDSKDENFLILKTTVFSERIEFTVRYCDLIFLNDEKTV